jgi:hypothetical protein
MAGKGSYPFVRQFNSAIRYQSKMKVVFLDIDGVLNIGDTTFLPEVYVMADLEKGEQKVGFNVLSASCISQLNRVTETTGAKIVISSSWRCGLPTPKGMRLLATYLKSCGVTGDIISRTPIYPEYAAEMAKEGKSSTIIALAWARGKEIQLWLDKHLVDSFVIVDDMSDMEHLTPFLVQTNFEDGITKEVSDKMIEVLNAPPTL